MPHQKQHRSDEVMRALSQEHLKPGLAWSFKTALHVTVQMQVKVKPSSRLQCEHASQWCPITKSLIIAGLFCGVLLGLNKHMIVTIAAQT
jgi:hypothetical protein